MEISINKKTYKLPEQWTEIDKAKLLPILRLLYVLPENGTTYHEILRTVLGYDYKQWAKLMQHYFSPKLADEIKDNNAAVLQETLQAVEWLWTSDLTLQPLDFIELQGTKYYLHKERFRGVTFEEMSDAYMNAIAFIEQLEEGNNRLNWLLAIVCRPARKGNYKTDPNWNGDHREPYNQALAETRVKLWETSRYEDKIVVMMFYLGTLKDFLSKYDIYNNEGPSQSEEEYPGQSLKKNLHFLSEKGIFGSMDSTKKANVSDVFLFLEEYNKDERERRIREEAINNQSTHDTNR